MTDRQAEVLRLMRDGAHIHEGQWYIVLTPTGQSIYLHRSRFKSLLSNQYIEPDKYDLHYNITPAGLDALAEWERRKR